MKDKVETTEQMPAIARVGDLYLYLDEIIPLIPKGSNKEDSLSLVNRYASSWVKKQLILREAGENKIIDQAEIERKITEYRFSLISYEFEKNYIAEKLDTLVSDAEIAEFYENHKADFELKQNIVKAKFIKVPKDVPRIDRLKRLLNSQEAKDLDDLKSFCFRFANFYVLEDTIWFEFEEIINGTPFMGIPDKVQFLKNNKFAEASDSVNTYFLQVKEYKIEDQTSPLQFVQERIRNIVINKRKINLATELEKEIYNKAIENKEVEIFSN